MSGLPDKLLTPAEVRAELQIGRSLCYELLASGRLPSIRVSPRVIRVLKSDLEHWVEAHRKASEEAGDQ